MSNSIAPGSSADVNVRVTALTTNPNVPVTYKTIILKKNLVNGVNTLTQEMMSAANTKYVIKYDYTLGEDITIPENCILEFDGGSISASGNNDTITGASTSIQAGLVKIFNTNLTITGTWNVAEAYPEWFGAKGDGVTDDNTPIQKTINCFRKIAFASNKVYGFSNIEIPNNRELCGGGKLLWLITPTQGNAYYPIHTVMGTRVNNVSIHNLTFDGNENNAGIDDSTYAVCDTLTISGNNIEVYNCEFVNNVDSGIMFSECKQSQIHHNHIKTATDAGIYVNANDIDDGMDCFSIHDNIIEDCGTAIGLKRITSYGVVNNNIINNCYGGITLENASTSTDFSKQIDICNNYIKNLTGGYGINVRGGYNHNVIGNRIEANATVDNSEVVVIDSCQNVNFNSNIIYSTRSNSVILISQRDINYPIKDININNNIVKHSNTFNSLLIFSNIQASDTEFKNVNIVGNIFEGTIQINYSLGLKNFIISNNKSSLISLDNRNASEILINNNDASINQNTIVLINKELSYGGRVQRTYITYHKSYVDNFQFKTGDKLILADAFEGFEYMYLATGDGLGSNVLTKKIIFA